MYSQGSLLFLIALTPLHPGVGRAEGAHVDLPVQRDEFGFPTVWASSLKGALRSRAELPRFEYQNNRPVCPSNKVDECGRVLAVFGPTTDYASEHSSLIALLDARLLLIPVRLLRGVWGFATSPTLLRNYLTYLEVLPGKTDEIKGKIDELLKRVRDLRSGVAAPSDTVENEHVVVNEVKLRAVDSIKPEEVLNVLPGSVVNEIRRVVGDRPIIVVGDDEVGRVVRRSLLVQYRVRLERPTKTVAEGALWSEEYLPQFTVMVSAVLCRDPKFFTNVKIPVHGRDKPEDKKPEDLGLRSAQDVCSSFRELVGFNGSVVDVWLGGKETIGRGLVRLVAWP